MSHVGVLQQICEEWAKKPEHDQQFDPFYRAVHAAANSSGIKLKTRAQLLTKVLEMYGVKGEEVVDSGLDQ